jgi:hypothetical protein
VRYDGTPKTLPEVGLIVFIYSKDSGVLPITTIYNGKTWELNMTTPKDPDLFYLAKTPIVGDMWTPIPKPPERI